MHTLEVLKAGMSVEVCAHCHTRFGSILLQWASAHRDDNLDQRGALELWSLSWRTYWAEIAQVVNGEEAESLRQTGGQQCDEQSIHSSRP